MGRGRAKAKQTKVARQLKYTTTGTDLDRLRAELTSDAPNHAQPVIDVDEADEDDPYAAYVDDEDDDEEDAEPRVG
jgi:hypothetical protein